MNKLDQAQAVAQFKADLVAAKDGNDLASGLEVKLDGGPKPETDMSRIDPEWEAWQQRQESAQASEAAAWEVASAATEESILQGGIRAGEEAVDYQEIVEAGLSVLAGAGAETYGQWLDAVEPSDRVQIDGDVRASLAMIADQKRETEFAETMAESERLNVESARNALAAVKASRGMSDEAVERAAIAYQEAVGQPLRTSLLSVPVEQREQFVTEVAVAHEAQVRADKQRAFVAQLFGAPSTDIEDGLRVAGGVPRDLPPVLLDERYALHRATEAVRREDAERQSRPEAPTAQEIREQLVAPDERSIESGLTDSRGRPVTFAELAARDPDSQLNQNARERERQARRIAHFTGARIVR